MSPIGTWEVILDDIIKTLQEERICQPHPNWATISHMGHLLEAMGLGEFIVSQITKAS